MKPTNRIFFVLAGCAVAVAAECAQAQDWPQWRGPNRDGKAAGFTAPKAWPKELTKKWSVPVGAGDATPALVGDKLYVFSRQDDNEVIRCLSASDGKELWADKYNAPAIRGPDASQHSGPRSSPAVAEGKVVTLGVLGTLSCLDAASGKVVWRKDDFPNSFPRFHTGMSPIIIDGLAVAQLGKEMDGAMVAYDLASGDQKWKWTAEGPGYASPVLLSVEGTKMIVTLTSKSIVGISPKDGSVLWQAPFAPSGMTYNSATPIVDGQTVIYGGQGRGMKAVKIEKDGDKFAAKDLWSNPDSATQFNTPVLKNGLIFGISGRDALFCLSGQDGKSDWTAPISGMRGFGSIVDAGPVLMALTPSSQLVVFEPNDKEFKQVASYKVADNGTYAYPVPAGNRVFVKDQDSVTLWTVE